MFVEKGALPIGVFRDGRLCTEYYLEPLRVGGSIATRKGPDFERAKGNDELMGLLSLASRLKIEGIPPEVLGLDAMLAMYDDDLAEILAADGRLKEQIARFRGKGATAVDPDAAKDRPALGDGQQHGAGDGAAVDRGLGGDQ